MRVLVNSLVAIAVIFTLSACASDYGPCPPGTHPGPHGKRCWPD